LGIAGAKQELESEGWRIASWRIARWRIANGKMVKGRTSAGRRIAGLRFEGWIDCWSEDASWLNDSEMDCKV
jgi:hypothetical protein